MKSIINILLVLGLTTASYSQNISDSGLNEEVIKTINLPEVVIKSAGKDFSIYLTDKNSDPSVRKLENEFIGYDLGKDYEGFENYLVILEVEKGKLTATYDANGKLINVVEKYNNTQIPIAVIYSVYKAYPGWQIVNDKYLYSQENGKNIKKEYNLKIKKDKETIKLLVNSKGEILEKK